MPQSWIDQQLARDPAGRSADYMATFRNDIAGFIDREMVMACVVPGLRERPPDRSVRHHAFVDPSGGSTDSFTLCIAHNDIARRTVILDGMREIKAPFSPEKVVAEFCQLMKSYNMLSCQRRPLRQGMAGRGVPPPRHPLHAGRPAQERPLCRGVVAADQQPADRAVRLARADRANLQPERSTRHGGAERIDHPPHGHDDVVNAVAGVAAICSRASGYIMDLPGLFDDNESAQATARPSPIPSGWSLEDFERRTRPISRLPSEYLPPGTMEAFARARLDALRRAHPPANGGGEHGGQA